MESGKETAPVHTCILHSGNEDEIGTGKIHPIKVDQWLTIKQAASRRQLKRNFATSKYFRVVQSLPDEPGEHHGYHYPCYKNFTAMPHHDDPRVKTTPVPDSGKTLRSSSDLVASTSKSGIFPRICLFCKKARKKKGGTEEHLGLCETKEAEQTIKAAAVAKQDNALLAKISDVDFCCKEVRYHHSCRSAYLLDTPSVSKPTDSTALSCIYGYIEKSVIVDKRPELLTSIYIRYKELCEDAEEAPITTARNLATNLSNKFGDKIRIECSAARKSGHIVYLTGLDSQLVHLAYDYAATPEATINKAALLLRKAIKKTPTTPLPENVTLQSLFQGEITAPNLLLQFFQVLYGGPNQKAYSPKLEQRVLSASHDAMFIAQRGKVKPGKQIVLGMAIKSMTGSRKLIEMLNRHGHIINYHAIEEIETSLGEEIQSRELACPEGTLSDMNFGLAFDNFDELPETLSGAGTLHDTMGIFLSEQRYRE